MGGVGAVATLGGSAPLASEYTITIAGHSFGLFGTKGFFLSGDAYDVSVFGLFLFSMVFMDTAATIPTGAMAERWKWGSFVLYALFMSMFIYPIFGNWVWGGGMDWHSSGITTSVMGALKRGLAPRANDLGLHVCGGRGRFSRNTPNELRALAD